MNFKPEFILVFGESLTLAGGENKSEIHGGTELRINNGGGRFRRRRCSWKNGFIVAEKKDFGYGRRS